MAIHTSISLFSGGGGLDLGVHLASPETRVVCFVEREAYAAATLVARMEAGHLAPATIWSDVSSFNGVPWRGRVDLVTGGFPCQDISNAGTRAGIIEGKRSGLWREYARIIGEVRPEWVFIENVAALIKRGLDVVLGDLAALGFDAEWSCYRASDVGAPHKRDRVFLLAHARCFDLDGLQSERQCWRSEASSTGGDGEVVAHRHHHRRESERLGGLLDGERATRGNDVDGCGGSELEYASGEGLEPSFQSLAAGSDELSAWPPGPEERDRWRELLRVRSDLEPAVCGGAHGLAAALDDRVHRLRMLGNGVVPQVAALAFVDLMALFRG